MGHRQSLLKLDETKYSEEETDFGERMMKLYHIITSIALLNASPLHRWFTSIILLLPKDKETPKIHRLRIMNTYESEYKFNPKLILSEEGYEKGRKKYMIAIEIASLNKLIIESHRLTKQSLYIYQDDAMGCYDVIIRTHVILNSRKFGIPDNICKLHLKAHDNMNF